MQKKQFDFNYQRQETVGIVRNLSISVFWGTLSLPMGFTSARNGHMYHEGASLIHKTSEYSCWTDLISYFRPSVLGTVGMKTECTIESPVFQDRFSQKKLQYPSPVRYFSMNPDRKSG